MQPACDLMLVSRDLAELSVLSSRGLNTKTVNQREHEALWNFSSLLVSTHVRGSRKPLLLRYALKSDHREPNLAA